MVQKLEANCFSDTSQFSNLRLPPTIRTQSQTKTVCPDTSARNRGAPAPPGSACFPALPSVLGRSPGKQSTGLFAIPAHPLGQALLQHLQQNLAGGRCPIKCPEHASQRPPGGQALPCFNPTRNQPTPTRVSLLQQPQEHPNERHIRVGHRHPDPDHRNPVFHGRVLD